MWCHRTYSGTWKHRFVSYNLPCFHIYPILMAKTCKVIKSDRLHNPSFFLQSQRLKQRSDKHMKEKYSGYYKKLKLFQDPGENPENEGNRGIVGDDRTRKYIWLYGNSLLNCEIRDCVGFYFFKCSLRQYLLTTLQSESLFCQRAFWLNNVETILFTWALLKQCSHDVFSGDIPQISIWCLILNFHAQRTAIHKHQLNDDQFYLWSVYIRM